MNRKFWIFCLGLFVSGVISILAYGFVFYSTFDPFGTDEVQDPEKFYTKIFYPIFVLLLCNVLVSILLFKLNRKSAAKGSALPILLAVVILFKVAPRYLDKSRYYEPFDQVEWMKDSRRLKMGRKLSKDSTLVGLNRGEVISKLGQPNHLDSAKHQITLVYQIEEDWINLAVIMDSDRVKKTQIWVRD